MIFVDESGFARTVEGLKEWEEVLRGEGGEEEVLYFRKYRLKVKVLAKKLIGHTEECLAGELSRELVKVYSVDADVVRKKLEEIQKRWRVPVECDVEDLPHGYDLVSAS